MHTNRTGLSRPRFMTVVSPGFDGNRCGTLLFANKEAGQIVAIDQLGLRPVIYDLDGPTSLSIYKGYLYVGETSKVSRFLLKSLKSIRSNAPKRQIIIDNLPDNGRHTTKTVLAHNDKLYLSIGSSCNSCIEKDQRRATV